MSQLSMHDRRPWADVRFILHNDPSRKQALMAARCHIQREAWRRRRLEGLRRLQTGDITYIKSNLVPAATTTATTESWPSRVLDQAHSPSLHTWISKVSGDPFDTAATTIDSMLHAYLVFFANSMWPVFSVHRQSHQFLKTLGAIAVEDEAVLYAIATSAAARQKLQALHNASLPNLLAQHQLYYMHRALRCLRVRLEDTPSAISENTIGLIALLAMCEAVDPGRVATSRLHLLAATGILNTPDGRRGVSWIWYERLAAADIKSACIGSTLPLLPPLDRTQSTRRIRGLIAGGKAATTSAFESLEVTSHLSTGYRQLIQDIRDLSVFKDALMVHRESLNDDGFDLSLFQYQRIALEQALLLLTPSSTAPFLKTSIQSFIFLGLVLFINTTFWVNFGASSAILSLPSQRLRQLLELEEVVDPFSVSLPAKTLRCWLIFVGAHATHTTGQYLWFKSQLMLTLRELDLQSCSQLQEVLALYIYAEHVHRPTLEDIFR